MAAKGTFYKIIDNAENVICQVLLVSFVLILFAQILLRNFYSYSLPWGDELATYCFVWFAYFGAVYAAKMSAHNRVTFQFKFLPPIVEKICEAIADLIWLGFNFYFVYLSYDFVFNKMNLFWKSQTLGVPMKYFYMILPLAFLLMSIRIIQNNYLKLVKGVEIVDPEAEEIEKIKRSGGKAEQDEIFKIQ